MLSVINCRTKRRYDDPTARRISISRCLPTARASRRFATFVHAIDEHQPNSQAHGHDERHELLQADECRRVGDADSRCRIFSFGDARCQYVHRGSSLRWRHMGLQASVESNGPVRAVAVQLIRWIATAIAPAWRGEPKSPAHSAECPRIPWLRCRPLRRDAR